MSGTCSGGRGNMLAVRNCCYVVVCLAMQGASAPMGEERGGGISWRPPVYSLLLIKNVMCFNIVGSATGRTSGLYYVGYWFVDGDDLTVALHILLLQLSPPHPLSLATIKLANPCSPEKKLLLK